MTKKYFFFLKMRLFHLLVCLQLLAELLEKRAPFNGMRGKRGEEVEQEVPQVSSRRNIYFFKSI